MDFSLSLSALIHKSCRGDGGIEHGFQFFLAKTLRCEASCPHDREQFFASWRLRERPTLPAMRG